MTEVVLLAMLTHSCIATSPCSVVTSHHITLLVSLTLPDEYAPGAYRYSKLIISAGCNWSGDFTVHYHFCSAAYSAQVINRNGTRSISWSLYSFVTEGGTARMSESVLDGFDTAIDLVVKRLRVKDLQRKIIYDIIAGRDVFATLPTGYGKSLCYRCLPLLFDEIYKPNESAIVCVASPLLGIIEDQVCPA